MATETGIIMLVYRDAVRARRLRRSVLAELAMP
jgi:hypothetical protein